MVLQLKIHIKHLSKTYIRRRGRKGNDRNIFYACLYQLQNYVYEFYKTLYVYVIIDRSTNSLDMSDLTEASVANITISNESLTKTGESIVVSGKGMGSTVKVNKQVNHTSLSYLYIFFP